jgi:hypothetical protein
MRGTRSLSVRTGEFSKLQSCDIDGRAGDFLQHKSTRVGFSSAAACSLCVRRYFLCIYYIANNLRCALLACGALKLVREIKGAHLTRCWMSPGRQLIVAMEIFCQCHAWLLVHQQESGFGISFLVQRTPLFDHNETLVCRLIQDWATLQQ